MIERAARAFTLAASGTDEWDTLDADTCHRLKHALCTALVTMREPDAAVIRAGARQSRRVHRSTALQVEAVWQAMIDTAAATS